MEKSNAVKKNDLVLGYLPKILLKEVGQSKYLYLESQKKDLWLQLLLKNFFVLKEERNL